MRRPGLLIAGMFLATGAGLGLASPASATVGQSGADSPGWYHCHSQRYWDDWNDWDHGGGNWVAGRSAQGDSHRRCHRYHHRHGHGHIWLNGPFNN